MVTKPSFKLYPNFKLTLATRLLNTILSLVGGGVGGVGVGGR